MGCAKWHGWMDVCLAVLLLVGLFLLLTRVPIVIVVGIGIGILTKGSLASRAAKVM
jgi:hypothetical protein